MSELVEWYRAQLAEDARVAQAAIEPDQMHPWGDRALERLTPEQWPDEVRGLLGGTWGEHCARQDPARVLREVAAKRAIVDRYGEFDEDSGDDCESCWAQGLGEAVQHLASVYADRPGYREEWKP
jgi:Family of unknown function (DUF6221)